MEYKEKVVLTKSYVVSDDDENADPEKEEQKETLTQLDFSTQLIMREMALDDLQTLLVLPSKEHKITFKMQLVENPSHEVLMKAQVKLTNKLIFDAIQEIQSQKKVRTNQEIHEYVKLLDQEVDAYLESCFKIKDRDIKKDII